MICLEIKAIKHLMLCTPVGKSIQMSQLYIHYPGTIKQGRTGNLSSSARHCHQDLCPLPGSSKNPELGQGARDGAREGTGREERREGAGRGERRGAGGSRAVAGPCLRRSPS